MQSHPTICKKTTVCEWGVAYTQRKNLWAYVLRQEVNILGSDWVFAQPEMNFTVLHVCLKIQSTKGSPSVWTILIYKPL